MWHGKKDSILNCNNSVSLLLHFELQILQESYIFMWDLWFTESWFSEEKRRKEYLFLYGVNSKRAPLQRGPTPRNVSLRNSLHWPIHTINTVDEPNELIKIPEWCSITVCSETYLLYLRKCFFKSAFMCFREQTNLFSFKAGILEVLS